MEETVSKTPTPQEGEEQPDNEGLWQEWATRRILNLESALAAKDAAITALLESNTRLDEQRSSANITLAEERRVMKQMQECLDARDAVIAAKDAEFAAVKKERDCCGRENTAQSHAPGCEAQTGYEEHYRKRTKKAEESLARAEKVVEAARPVAMDNMDYAEMKGWEAAKKRAFALDDALAAYDAANTKEPCAHASPAEPKFYPPCPKCGYASPNIAARAKETKNG